VRRPLEDPVVEKQIIYSSVQFILLALIVQDIAPWLAWQYSSLTASIDFA
jgi:hypothetical protein